MISSSLKALTRVSTRSFRRCRIINNNLIKPTYFKNIQISKRFYHNTPGQSINTKNFSEIRDNKDENINSYGNPIEENSVSNTTINTDGRAKNNQQKTTNFNELPYNEKLKKVYQKHPYGNEGQANKNEEHNQDPMSVMYSNLAKDEDLNAKDNHISDDDKNKNKNFSQQSLLEQMSETTYGMPASGNNIVNVSDKSRITDKIHNQQNLSEQQNKMKKQFDQNNKHKSDRNLNDSNIGNVFHKVNQDENFHNTYVGDVEFKIPSQQSPINEDLNMKNQQENEMDYQKSIQSQNYNQSNLSSSNTMNKENNNNNNNNNMGMKDSNEKHGEHLKKKVSSTNVDLDLSTKSFQKKMEEYKQNNASNDNTIESSKSYSKNDYFLKDNNSEYNKYISNQPDSDFVEENNIDNYNKTTDNIHNTNNNYNSNKKTSQSKYSLLPSEKDHESESEVNESLEGHNVTGRDETAIDKDEEPAKDHNMYHNKGHLFPNH